jgi:hypothetical protein
MFVVDEISLLRNGSNITHCFFVETPRCLALFCKLRIRKMMFKRMEDFHRLYLPPPLIKYVVEIEAF